MKLQKADRQTIYQKPTKRDLLGSTKTKIDEKEFNKIYRRAEKAEKRENYETEILLLDQLLEADPCD